jgi:hypothetical protein
MTTLKSAPIWDGYRRGRGIQIAVIGEIARLCASAVSLLSPDYE